MADLKQIEKALFESARELDDPETRAAFLDQACGENTGLRQKLKKLLSVDAAAENFFSLSPVHLSDVAACQNEPHAVSTQPVPPNGSSNETANAVIGRYRLVERLGEGGRGVVYMAEQQEPVSRKVALKIIRLGMDTERVIARFEMERQALALMNHPNIAQVLDAGATETGRPYFVMELVPGVKITDYCNERRLDTSKRLDLFIQVCLAIQHAHQKGILHRDIKPSNILVTEQDSTPVPKVIDFGIAKAVEGRLADTSFTICDQFVGTPAYMSPEQAETNGMDVDTRSDIYSLGALLYELLTGRPPFDTKELMKSGVDELRRALREREPQPPSVMLQSLNREELASIATQHDTEPSRLLAIMRGDLDWIVMMALEKDRQRRYATANGLASDIQRYLKDEPVAARPPSRIYRFRKLVRRNRATFAGIAAVAVALILGLGTSTWLFLREREDLRRETHLRTEAEKGEKLSRAAFFAKEGNFDGANALLEEIGAPPEHPSLDGVVAYRTVGDWLAVQERWQEAAAHYVALIHLDQLDVWDPVTLDYQACGVLLMETNDVETYARFCEKAAARYATETNGDAVGRVLKTCLLRPADDKLIGQLRQLGKTTERWTAAQDPGHLPSWAAIPVSLWRYRTGDCHRAADYARDTLLKERNIAGACEATLRLILAMADFQSGQPDEARSELARSHEILDSGFKAGLIRHDSSLGSWYDWVFARVLLREASAMIGESQPGR